MAAGLVVHRPSESAGQGQGERHTGRMTFFGALRMTGRAPGIPTGPPDRSSIVMTVSSHAWDLSLWRPGAQWAEMGGRKEGGGDDGWSAVDGP
jgi:hypothetical protein